MPDGEQKCVLGSGTRVGLGVCRIFPFFSSILKTTHCIQVLYYLGIPTVQSSGAFSGHLCGLKYFACEERGVFRLIFDRKLSVWARLGEGHG